MPSPPTWSRYGSRPTGCSQTASVGTAAPWMPTAPSPGRRASAGSGEVGEDGDKDGMGTGMRKGPGMKWGWGQQGWSTHLGCSRRGCDCPPQCHHLPTQGLCPTSPATPSSTVGSSSPTISLRTRCCGHS